MSACAAIEDACGVTVPAAVTDLRRLLYCGERIESHALHIYLLHAPDFLGYRSGIEMAADRRDLVERGLALKKAGNAIMTVVGGRAIHPVNVRLGGFYRAPARADLAALAEPLKRALDDALATVRWVAGPLARYALGSRWLSPLAREAARAAGLGETCDNPFRSIIVRAVETVYAVEEALRLIAAYTPPEPVERALSDLTGRVPRPGQRA